MRDFLVTGFRDGLSRADRLTAEFTDGMVAPYVTRAGAVSLARNASGLNTSHTTMLVDRHATIRAPTLLVRGEDDPWQPIGDGERLAADIPAGRLVRVPNASHWITQDAPDEWLEAVMPFVAGRAGPSQRGVTTIAERATTGLGHGGVSCSSGSSVFPPPGSGGGWLLSPCYSVGSPEKRQSSGRPSSAARVIWVSVNWVIRSIRPSLKSHTWTKGASQASFDPVGVNR